jgi:RNA polymerase sigma-B factor
VKAAPGKAQERLLFLRYHHRGDLGARERLVTSFLPLARHLARRYERPGEPLEDLIQVANLALVKAVDRFDPKLGAAFSSYAVPTILGELKRHFRDSGWALHVPRGMQERTLELSAAIDQLHAQLGRSPNPQQLAAHLSQPVERVLETMAAARAYETLPLDLPNSANDDHRPIADTLGATDPGLELAEHRPTLRRAIKALPTRERAILHMRFAHCLTQAEIAEQIGVSQMQVSRLLSSSLERLRTLTGEEAASATPPRQSAA